MSLTKVSYSMINGAPVNALDFGAVGDGVTDDTDAIQAAIDSLPVAPTTTVGSVLLASGKTFKITSPLVLQRGQSLIGDGTPVILADFSSWTGDLYALEFVTKTADSSAAIYTSFAQASYGFTLKGINNSSVISTGMRFYTTASNNYTNIVNYAYIGSISDIYVTQFDTAIEMNECWNSTFSNVKITNCRVGLVVSGKSVNVFVDSIQIQNPSKAYTSSTGNTFAIYSQSKTYSDGEGRPEGFTFINGLVFGYDTNVSMKSGFQFIFDSMVLDGAVADCINILGPDDLLITNCYIYTGSTASCVYIEGVAAANNSSITISNNSFVGTAPTNVCYGINFISAGASRYGVKIQNNNFNALTTGINALQCPSYSVITDNYGEAITNQFINVLNNGVKTIIDGNTCSDNIPVLVCHPTSTSSTLDIGYNVSATQATQYKGKATLVAGQTTVALPNNLYGSTDYYIRPITSVTFNANPGTTWWVNEAASNSDSTLQVASAQGSDKQLHYTVTAVPYSAF